MKTLINKNNPAIRITAPEIKEYIGGYEIAGIAYCAKELWTLVEEEPVDLENNGWIDCLKQMPKETKQWSDTLQGHREWSESDRVLVWDSIYGCGVDATKNGKWMSEQRGGYTGQVVHGIIAWRQIPEFNEELLFNARKEE